jgi:hypothetical protein
MASGTTMQEPPRHSRRVEAWIYTVLNPLIESLRRELFFLEKGNLTWRSYSQHCEFIRPIAEYIDPNHLPNYEDFLADSLNSSFGPQFKNHDDSLSRAETTASEFYALLMQSDEFRRRVKVSFEEYELTAKSAPRYPGLEPVDKNLPQFVAEYLINRTDFLPSHYTMHVFWQDYKRRFESLVEEFEPYRDRLSFEAVEHAGVALRDLAAVVLRGAESHRQHLCVEYDIPFAPTHTNRPQ